MGTGINKKSVSSLQTALGLLKSQLEETKRDHLCANEQVNLLNSVLTTCIVYVHVVFVCFSYHRNVLCRYYNRPSLFTQGGGKITKTINNFKGGQNGCKSIVFCTASLKGQD